MPVTYDFGGGLWAVRSLIKSKISLPLTTLPPYQQINNNYLLKAELILKAQLKSCAYFKEKLKSYAYFLKKLKSISAKKHK